MPDVSPTVVPDSQEVVTTNKISESAVEILPERTSEQPVKISEDSQNSTFEHTLENTQPSVSTQGSLRESTQSGRDQFLTGKHSKARADGFVATNSSSPTIFEFSVIAPPPVDGNMQSSQDSRSQRQEDINSMIRQHQAKRLSEKTTSEHVVPVRLTAIQRRLYHTLLSDNVNSIEHFCQSPTSSSECRTAISALLSALQKVVVHPLLLADEMPETQMSPSDEAWYLVQSASKFELIVDVLESLKMQEVRIAIFCDGDRERQIWTSVLGGLDIPHHDISGATQTFSTQDTFSPRLGVLLISAAAQDTPGISADLAFVLTGSDRLEGVPNVLLVAESSVEHVLLQISDPRAQLTTIANLSDSVGLSTSDTGSFVTRVMNVLCGLHCTSEGLDDITNWSSQQIRDTHEPSEDEGPAHKRHCALLDETLLPPKILVTKINGLEVHTEAQPDDDTSRQGRVVDGARSGQSLPANLELELSDTLTQPQTQTQFISPAHLEKQPTQIYAEDSKQIWTKPTAEQERIAALEEDLDRILLRFDDLREECHELAEQKDAACLQAAALQKRFERAIEETRAAKQDKNEMKLELDRIKMPALPEESSPEYMATENIRLKTELEKMKKSAESKAQDFDFVRQQYQQASSAAAESAGEAAALRTELETLKNKNPGGLGYKLALLQGEATQAALREEAENLTLRNNVLIEQLKRMRDERMAGRGRGDNRRELVASQDRKRATSASAEVGQRKKIDKVGTSRLSVASLISPSIDRNGTAFDPTSSPRATLQQMLRGQSQDTRSFGRERIPTKRPRTPMM